MKHLTTLQKILFYLFIISVTVDAEGQPTEISVNKKNPLTFFAAIFFSLWITFKDIRLNFKTVFKEAYKKG